MARILNDLAGTNQSAFRIGALAAAAFLSAAGLTAPRMIALPDASGTLATESYAAGVASLAQSNAIASAAASLAASYNAAHTWGALQTHSAGLTVSTGTTAVQALTCTTLTASGAVAINANDFRINSTAPQHWFNETDGAADAKKVVWQQSAGVFKLRFMNDAEGVANDVISIARSGATVGTLTISAPTTAMQAATCTTLTASSFIVSDITLNGINELRARNLSNGASSFAQIVTQNDSTRRAYFGVVGTGASGLGGANTAYIGANSSVYFIASDTVVGNWSTTGLVVGASALLASERLRVAGGTMGTPGATDVILAGGKVYAGDTSATSIQTAGSLRALGNSTKIGDGANTPVLTSTLHVNRAAANAAVITLQNATYELAFGCTTATFFGSRSATDLYIQRAGSNVLAITSTAIDLTAGIVYKINGTQVVGPRSTGWTAQTATASKADLGASPTNAALASFCRSLYDAMAGHGLIGT